MEYWNMAVAILALLFAPQKEPQARECGSFKLFGSFTEVQMIVGQKSYRFCRQRTFLGLDICTGVGQFNESSIMSKLMVTLLKKC